MLRAENDLAYVLHQRPYRENSVIVQFLTEQNGQIDLVVNGIRSKKNPKRALLQTSQGLRLDYHVKTTIGKSTLGACKRVEADILRSPLSPKHYFTLQYAHELLLKILPNQVASDTIFQSYQTMLDKLRLDQDQHAIRQIEMTLIDAFASLPDLTKSVNGQAIDKNCYYIIHPEFGARLNTTKEGFTGEQIQAFTACLAGDFSGAKEAKALTQQFLGLLIDQQSMRTKRIFQTLSHL